ncbi:putative hydroxymethyltransferase [Annulohypoxylon maeteangense]|uniref:putative hydroxymethyltransferase n=1 Tax=Annulohypoxylon maeteangense TaxID=1927788 RepID=UPI002008A186|nr:putative hydroxymethyltransferase [Annulohypoxylon maeteangense]KAI0879886.1 putative hydroxymethyltransferase [Annulohypoxylon maeteangense]
MSRNIICDVDSPSPDIWYGTLVVSNIRYDDDTSVTIQKLLGLKFKSPKATGKITCDVSLTSYEATKSQVYPSKPSEDVNDVTAQVHFTEPHTFVHDDHLTFGIVGDLTTDLDTFKNSFKLYAESLPSGTVIVKVATTPDPALTDAQQVVYLERDGTEDTILASAPGTTESYTVEAYKYDVKAADLATSDETTVASALASPSQVEVQVGGNTDIGVTYGVVQKYSALDVSIGALSQPITTERLHVKVVDDNNATWFDDFLSPNGTKKLRRLPVSGSVDISAQITLNDVKYSAAQNVQLSQSLIRVSINQNDIKAENVDTTGFVVLPVEIQTDATGSDVSIPIRFASTSQDVIYKQQISIASNSAKFDVPVAPGDYIVKADGFIIDSTVYGVQAPATLTVNSDGSTVLQLTTQKGASLAVRGFPDILSYGGLTDLYDLSGSDFVAADAYAAFKYAGNDGAGDSDRYLEDDPATRKTIQLAEAAASELKHPVLPIMISYTVNLSQGDDFTHLQNKDALMYSFGNLILSMSIANSTATQSVPVGYIVNPDFLGECQKGPTGEMIKPEYDMVVREPLQDALKYRKVDAEIPDSVTDTLKGYVVAVNWLIRTVAPKATFGWQTNLWGVGKSDWIYKKDDPTGPAEMAKETADYVKTLGVYSGDYRPDFLAIDRYEADDFTQRAYGPGYCYGPYEWDRFYDFCGALSLELQVPVAPWQIPASRIPARTEIVNDLETDHWGSGGTYIFGDPAIASDYHNINPQILEITPAEITTHPSVEDIFASAPPFDLSYPSYGSFPLRGIFTVLLGGGSTTGIVKSIGKTGEWTQSKVHDYMDNPVPLSY